MSCIIRSRPLQLLSSYSRFEMWFQKRTTEHCVAMDLSLRERLWRGAEVASMLFLIDIEAIETCYPCGGHGFFCRGLSHVYVFGCFRLNKGFNGHHVGSGSPAVLTRDPFVFSKSAHGDLWCGKRWGQSSPTSSFTFACGLPWHRGADCVCFYRGSVYNNTGPTTCPAAITAPAKNKTPQPPFVAYLSP